ncbi:MAG: hypothetical protein IT431_15355 [Phycisphaerales bacterium]|nr:hypothetical protein [Phycisphaerales bacterium]
MSSGIQTNFYDIVHSLAFPAFTAMVIVSPVLATKFVSSDSSSGEQVVRYGLEMAVGMFGDVSIAAGTLGLLVLFVAGKVLTGIVDTVVNGLMDAIAPIWGAAFRSRAINRQLVERYACRIGIDTGSSEWVVAWERCRGGGRPDIVSNTCWNAFAELQRTRYESPASRMHVFYELYQNVGTVLVLSTFYFANYAYLDRSVEPAELVRPFNNGVDLGALLIGCVCLHRATRYRGHFQSKVVGEITSMLAGSRRSRAAGVAG